MLTIIVLSVSKHQQVSYDAVNKVNCLLETQAKHVEYLVLSDRDYYDMEK